MKKKSLLLPLIALALVGCGDRSTSVSPSKPTTETPVSNQSNKGVESTKPASNSTKPATGSTTPSNTPSVAPSTGSASASASASESENSGSGASASGSSATSGTGSTNAGSSTASSDIYNTKWKKETVDTMVQYLGGRVLPYVELGSKVIPTWDSDASVLTLMGNITTGITAARIQTAKTDYEAAGWTVTTTATSMTAVNAEKDITVVFFDDEGILALKATYKEVFDPTKASAWPADLVNDMNTSLANHAADIPFVYLGTVNPTGSFTTYSSTYTITGGEWDDQIPTLAKTAFEAANATIAADANKWVISNGTNSYGPTFSANVTLADGTRLEVSIEAPYTYSYSSSKRIAKMEIKFKEAFSIPTNGAWPTEVTDSFTNNFGGHTFPYFYIGSSAPSVYYSTYTGKLEIHGLRDTWDDQIPTLLKNALDAENATITEAAQKWTYTENGTKITGSRTFVDGCVMKFDFDHYTYSDYADLYISYVPAYVVPAGADWSADTKTAFTDHLNGAPIPYVYLGTLNETATWSDQYSTLEIEGADYFGSVLNGALNAFTTAGGWTAALTTQKYSYYDYYYDMYYDVDIDIMKAEKVIDATTGEKLTVTVGPEEVDTYTGNPDGNCIMDIVYTKPYVIPTTAAWDTATDTFIKTNLGGHELPYVYLNSSTITTYVPSYGTTYITLTGGLFVDGILTYAKTQFTAANWTNPTIANNQFTASITEADGCELSVTISENAKGLVELKCTFKEGFNTSLTDWSDDFKASMKKCLSNNVIPFIQLGTTNPKISEYASSNNVTITGKVWKDSIIDDAKTALEAAGWSCVVDAFSTDKRLEAFIVNADGSMLALKLYNSSGAWLDVYYYPASTIPATAKSAWSDDENTFISGVAGSNANMVPFLYMGDGDYTTATATASTDAKITGTAFNAKAIVNYYTTLKGLGYTEFQFNIFSSSITLKAKATMADGSTVQLTVDYTGYGSTKKTTLAIKALSSFVIPTGDDAKWSDDIKTAIENHIGDGICLPFIYLGTDTVTTKSYTNELDLVGGVWDDQILTLAYDAFKNSTDGWEVIHNYYDNQVMASMTTPSGKKVKVNIKKNYSDKPLIEIYAK